MAEGLVEYAIILAGGEGKRLRPLTENRPKPMILLNGVPILMYQVRQLREAGVTTIVFGVSYMANVVQDYFGNGERFGFKALYSVEAAPLGTGGAIKQAMRTLPEGWQNTFVTNGDNLWKLDLNAMAKKHLDRKAQASDFLTQLRSPYGLADVNESDEITGFREKPLLDYWLNGGVYILSKDLQPLLPNNGAIEIETFPNIPKNKFVAFKSNDYWRGIDTIKDYEEAEKEAAEIFG